MSAPSAGAGLPRQTFFIPIRGYEQLLARHAVAIERVFYPNKGL